MVVLNDTAIHRTNREECALSSTGMQQVEASLQQLRGQNNFLPTVIKHSLAASSIDTANLIGREFKVGRDRIVAEYTFMDPRAVGKFDMMPYRATEAAIWALDATEAGPRGDVSSLSDRQDNRVVLWLSYAVL